MRASLDSVLPVSGRTAERSSREGELQIGVIIDPMRVSFLRGFQSAPAALDVYNDSVKVLALLRLSNSRTTDTRPAPRSAEAFALTWRRGLAACALLCAAGLSLAQEHEGNFVIRFEPRAVLQANTAIPFEIRVNDDRHNPVLGATVTLQIETLQHTDVKVFNAPSIDQGIYIAKPVFPSAGEWSIYVEVHRSGQMSARTIEFNVPESAVP